MFLERISLVKMLNEDDENKKNTFQHEYIVVSNMKIVNEIKKRLQRE